MNKQLRPIYQSEEINSETIAVTITKFQEILSLLDNGHIILWQHHGLFFRTVTDGQVRWSNSKNQVEENIDHVVQLRFFNTNKELLLKKSQGELIGRWRNDLASDGDNSKIKVVETIAKIRDSLILTSEHSFIKTRNYVRFDEHGKMSIIDMRFIQYSDKNN